MIIQLWSWMKSVDKYLKFDGVRQEIFDIILPKSLNGFLYISFISPIYKEIYEWVESNVKKDCTVFYGDKKWHIKGATIMVTNTQPLRLRVKFDSFLNTEELVKSK